MELWSCRGPEIWLLHLPSCTLIPGPTPGLSCIHDAVGVISAPTELRPKVRAELLIWFIFPDTRAASSRRFDEYVRLPLGYGLSAPSLRNVNREYTEAVWPRIS